MVWLTFAWCWWWCWWFPDCSTWSCNSVSWTSPWWPQVFVACLTSVCYWLWLLSIGSIQNWLWTEYWCSFSLWHSIACLFPSDSFWTPLQSCCQNLSLFATFGSQELNCTGKYSVLQIYCLQLFLTRPIVRTLKGSYLTSKNEWPGLTSINVEEPSGLWFSPQKHYHIAYLINWFLCFLVVNHFFGWICRISTWVTARSMQKSNLINFAIE